MSGAPSSETPSGPQAVLSPQARRTLLWLVVGQVALHGAMAGQRMAAPLQALEGGRSALSVGLLLALFAALPALTSMPVGRLADRRGYHPPLRLAVALGMAGAAMSLLACALAGLPQFVLLCLGAALSGAGTNVGLITVQRTAGQLSDHPKQRLRVFSWLGMAPSLANVVGPVTAGLLIDSGGYPLAYAALLLLPLVSLAAARRVPASTPQAPPARRGSTRRGMAELLALPGMKRLLFVNWVMSAAWDVHSFAVPILGHARGYNASTIGLLLGTFTAAVTLVRFIVPMLAERLDEVKVLTFAMLGSALALALYPLAPTPWLMGACSALLGLALGAVQPMIMSTLYHLTPAHRQGEAIALRTMAMNIASSGMPLGFGLAGAALGAGSLFWVMGAGVAGGSLAARGLRSVFAARASGTPPGG